MFLLFPLIGCPSLCTADALLLSAADVAQLIQDGTTFKTWTRWGRVGEYGSSALLGNGTLDDALKNFEKKFKDKSGLTWAQRGDDPKPSKYAYIERSYEPDSDDEDGGDDAKPASKVKDEESEDEQASALCTLEKPVEELMNLIFNQQYFREAMTSMNYDANKLPLGKLSKSTILRGFQALKDLSALFNDSTLADSKYSMTVAEATEHLSNLYYTLIPHAFGRNRPPIIRTGDVLKKEVDLLDSLSDMKVASDLMKVNRKVFDVHPADRQFQGLGMEEMTALDHKSTEFTLLSEYLQGSKGSTHPINYKVEDIFRIERQGELDRFQKSKLPSISSDRRLLWHGSRVTNFGGILSQGLRIAPPEAPSTGYMFGKGIYLADMSTKSANYCASYNSGGQALLLLCEAELGDPIQKLTNSSYHAGDTAKAGGMLSTWGQGSTGPSKWKDASCVHSSLDGIKMVSIPDMNYEANSVANSFTARRKRGARPNKRPWRISRLQRVHCLRSCSSATSLPLPCEDVGRALLICTSTRISGSSFFLFSFNGIHSRTTEKRATNGIGRVVEGKGLIFFSSFNSAHLLIQSPHVCRFSSQS